jgi:hypothetical protein
MFIIVKKIGGKDSFGCKFLEGVKNICIEYYIFYLNHMGKVLNILVIKAKEDIKYRRKISKEEFVKRQLIDKFTD